MLKLLIKFSDISNPTKNWENYKIWTELICEEFFTQGDEEIKRGLKVTRFMDRSNPCITELQIGFIKGLVKVSFTVLRSLTVLLSLL